MNDMVGAKPPCMLQLCAVDFTAVHLLRPLMLASRADGWEVEFACADGPGAAALKAEGFRYRPVPISRSSSPAAQVRAVLALASSLRADPPDLIHTHTPVGGMVGRLGSLMTGRSVRVHTFHGLPFIDGVPATTLERGFLAIERFLARRTHFFFSQAAGDLNDAVRLGIASRDRALVIGNGVDIDKFAPDQLRRRRVREELQIGEDAVVVLLVARLVREKGILELADAAMALADLDKLHVVVAGAELPSDRTGISGLLDSHPVAAALGRRWQRLGYRADIDALLAAADMFVLPTYREGLPRSIIEAMATGLPIVTTRIRACEELVTDGETGLLVPVRSVEALAAAIRELVGRADRRKAMGSLAREVAVSRHDERVVITRELDVLRRLVSA